MSHSFNHDHGKTLLKLARDTIAARLNGQSPPPLPQADDFKSAHGTFVTLKLAGQLRGCIGNLQPSGSIDESIRRNAINAAFHDYRFSPLTPEELPRIHIDISILTSPVELHYTDGNDLVHKLRPLIDGVILSLGMSSATFLPQVWEQLATPELFLGHLCRKAGLPENSWQTDHPRISVYQVQCFEEEQA